MNDVSEESGDGKAMESDGDGATDEEQAPRKGRRKGRKPRNSKSRLPTRLPANMEAGDKDVQSQAAMEEEFWKYFGDIVSEWNPCFSDDGVSRFVWDEESGRMMCQFPLMPWVAARDHGVVVLRQWTSNVPSVCV